MFEFATATRIIFGKDSFTKSLPDILSLGSKALVMVGMREVYSDPLIQQLKDAGIQCIPFRVKGEPTLPRLQEALALARAEQVNSIISIGGGSAIDIGKATAALLTNPGDALNYLEVVGLGNPLTNPSLPFIAIPTTAGTGSEVTKNAVIEVPEKSVKVSLRHAFLFPRLAIVDPSLGLSVPPGTTAYAGMDALTQVIEPFLSKKANPIVDAICREGIHRSSRSLRKVFFEGSDYSAREDMALASLIGGLALANAGLGAVHGFAAPIGGMFHAPHGAVCGRLLPAVMEINFQKMYQQGMNEFAVNRYQQISILLTGHASAQPQEAIAWVEETCELLEIPRLRDFGMSKTDFPLVIEKASAANSMKANPIQLTSTDLEAILNKAY